MKFIYPAVFHEEKDGKYKGYFPDLECCYGEGETIDVRMIVAECGSY